MAKNKYLYGRGNNSKRIMPSKVEAEKADPLLFIINVPKYDNLFFTHCLSSSYINSNSYIYPYNVFINSPISPMASIEGSNDSYGCSSNGIKRATASLQSSAIVNTVKVDDIDESLKSPLVDTYNDCHLSHLSSSQTIDTDKSIAKYVLTDKDLCKIVYVQLKHIDDMIKKCSNKRIVRELNKIREKLSSCSEYEYHIGHSNYEYGRYCKLNGFCPFCTNRMNFSRFDKNQAILERYRSEDETMFWVTLTNPNTPRPKGFKRLIKALKEVLKERTKSINRKNEKNECLESIRGTMWKHEFTIDKNGDYNHHIHMVVSVDKNYEDDFKTEFKKIWNDILYKLYKAENPWVLSIDVVPEQFTHGHVLHRYLTKENKDFSYLIDKETKEIIPESLIKHFDFFFNRRRNKDRSHRFSTTGRFRKSRKKVVIN